jgi:NADPH-dependent 2,4-dienoyl-CoA reductase/sulfur reductase-like enzyme/nitrite reductase/ring-hydroxylating ferredoxin subunit
MAGDDHSGGGDALPGPDLTQGVDASALGDRGVLLGHAGGEAVLVARRGDDVFAVSATCTHYGGPLAEGVVVGDTVRCPLHHACFSLRTGAALTPPALDPIACWEIERRGDRLVVLGKVSAAAATQRSAATSAAAAPMVIIGSGPAAHVAAETLRREGHTGALTIISAEESLPVDRPNLSKDYLAGQAPDEWMTLRPAEFFAERRIELVLGTRVARIDRQLNCVVTDGGATFPYGALLMATGAEPVRLTIPGADLPRVHTLRTLADCRAIIAGLGAARRAVVIGGSFIGLEVAASLRARGLEVHVVAPDALPLARVLGPEIGRFVQSLHEGQGVVFHLGHTARAIEADRVVLDSGEELPADVVVVGVGVRPSTALAESAGLAVDRGIVVNEYLETSAPGIFAAGDVARWPDPRTGKGVRIEHWVVAERLGQLAARNMLGHKRPCRFVPFFWTRQFGVSIDYIGHAETWDRIEVDGDLERRDARVRFVEGGRVLAVATIGRNRQALEAELELEAS